MTQESVRSEGSEESEVPMLPHPTHPTFPTLPTSRVQFGRVSAPRNMPSLRSRKISRTAPPKLAEDFARHPENVVQRIAVTVQVEHPGQAG